MRGGGYDESLERWGNLRGPEAVNARLQAIETRLEQLRRELVEVGRWDRTIHFSLEPGDEVKSGEVIATIKPATTIKAPNGR